VRHLLQSERATSEGRAASCFTLNVPKALALAAAADAAETAAAAASGAAPATVMAANAVLGAAAVAVDAAGGVAADSSAAVASAAGPVSSTAAARASQAAARVLVSRADQRAVAFAAQQVMELDVVAMLNAHLNGSYLHGDGDGAVAAEAAARASSGDNSSSSSSNGARNGGSNSRLSSRRRSLPAYDGLVLVGGCALNVRVNSAVAAAFPHLRVHVPAAPSDCGLGVGSAWLLYPPPLPPALPPPPPLRHSGPRLEPQASSEPSGSAAGHAGLNLHFLGPELFDLADPFDSRSGGSGSSELEVGLNAKGQVAFRMVRGGGSYGDAAAEAASDEKASEFGRSSARLGDETTPDDDDEDDDDDEHPYARGVGDGGDVGGGELGLGGGGRSRHRVVLAHVARALGAQRLFYTYGPTYSRSAFDAAAVDADANDDNSSSSSSSSFNNTAARDYEGADARHGGSVAAFNARGFAALAALLADEQVSET
jgi:hypothetical protein